MEIDYIKIGKRLEILFVGNEWLSEPKEVLKSVILGFGEQFQYDKGVLYLK